MPTYDYRCKHCGRDFALFYKTYKDYDAAERACPDCGSAALTRRIQRVTIGQASRSMANFSANEMLSVLDGGSSREVGRLFDQVGQTAGVENMSETYTEATQRLLKGESIQNVEKDLRDRSAGAAADAPGTSPKAASDG